MNTLKSGIGAILYWMYHNRLKLNENKTEFIVFASKQNSKFIEVTNLQVGGESIPSLPVLKNLGVYIDLIYV